MPVDRPPPGSSEGEDLDVFEAERRRQRIRRLSVQLDDELLQQGVKNAAPAPVLLASPVAADASPANRTRTNVADNAPEVN